MFRRTREAVTGAKPSIRLCPTVLPQKTAFQCLPSHASVWSSEETECADYCWRLATENRNPEPRA
jgi:hypothetical protein